MGLQAPILTANKRSEEAANASKMTRSSQVSYQFADTRSGTAVQRQQQELIQRKSKGKPNKTELPDQLKTGIEQLSGIAMDDVRVHYNSPKPAQFQAHAYAQGTDIHLGKGQEKHLPHEAWHVVQQKQGRVKPTIEVNGARVNDNAGLEQEADRMGARANAWTPARMKSLRNAHRMDKQSDNSVSQFVLPAGFDKRQSHYGDLYYGISDPRYRAAERIRGPRVRVRGIVSIDNINHAIGLTSLFSNGNDRVRSYFHVMDLIEQRHFVNDAHQQIYQDWGSYLHRHHDYLNLQGIVDAISTGNDDAKITKNIGEELPRQAIVLLQQAIPIAFQKKSITGLFSHPRFNRMNPRGVTLLTNTINNWVWNAFFRKTSKLGIRFTVENDRAIHMNLFVPGRTDKRGPHQPGLADVMAFPLRETERRPITFSELRYILRTYGPNHPQIHLFNYTGMGEDGDVENATLSPEARLYSDLRYDAGGLLPQLALSPGSVGAAGTSGAVDAAAAGPLSDALPAVGRGRVVARKVNPELAAKDD